MAVFSKVDGMSAPTGVVPSGIILIWHGTIANIPAGWVICDGNNGTPNLLERFVQQVETDATNPGGTGGSTAQPGNGHAHAFPAHTHNFTNVAVQTGVDSYYINGTTLPSLTHTHTWTGMTYAGGSSVSGTGSITDGRPQYYEVAFIMKT